METLLRKLRKQRGFTISFMARELGIPQGYYSEIETGKKTVTEERAQAIADILRVKKEKIFLPSRFAIRKVDSESSLKQSFDEKSATSA